ALDIVHSSLPTQSSFSSDLSRDLGDLASKLLQLVDHGVDCGLELKDFAPAVGLNLLRKITLGYSSRDFNDVSHLRRKIIRHGVDVDAYLPFRHREPHA
ncbi:hypothetical protein BN1723_010966, partial [Verticillium longisporum]